MYVHKYTCIYSRLRNSAETVEIGTLEPTQSDGKTREPKS